MSLIVIIFSDYIDEDEYQKYMDAAGPIFMREGVNFIVNDADPKPMTPNISMDKVVVAEFRDEAHMQHFFGLPDYKEAVKHRDKGVKMRTVITRRFEMPE